jgi:hypothetical protein
VLTVGSIEGEQFSAEVVARLQAGNRAYRMSAYEEAVTHFRRGLELAASLPQSADQMQLEIGGKELLAECYAWFTEGLDTPDLRVARALLQQLSQDHPRCPYTRVLHVWTNV